jgi:hypothetical protein
MLRPYDDAVLGLRCVLPGAISHAIYDEGFAQNAGCARAFV